MTMDDNDETQKLLEFEESNKKLRKQTAFYNLQVHGVKHKVASNLSPL